FIEPDEDIPEEHEATRMQHLHMLPQEDEEVDVDEFERRIRQRYSSQSYLEEGIDEISDVEQQALLPSIKDPKLWMVKCAMGREREAAVCLMQKRIDRGHREMQIRSVISPQYLKNYIYVEADKSAHVIEACKGLRILNTTKVMLVPIKEMMDVLSVEGNPIDIAKDMWVRLKIGIYKGDLAKVVNVSDVRRKVMVKLIPWVDLQAIADKLEGRKVLKKAYIPSARLMKIDEARNLNIPVDYRTGRSTNIQFCVIDGKMFKDGFLYKTVSMRSIDYQNIQPTFSELEKFCETGHGVVGSMSTSPRNRKKSHFMKGDAVIVVKGDLKNLMGWVEKVEEDNVHIRPKVKGLCTTVAVNEKYICKSFKPGDHVKVVFGAHKGVTGMVIKVNSNVLIILSDTTKEEIRVFAEHAVDSSEVTTGVTKVGDYELHDLVMLDNTCFGVIIRLESQTLQILLGDPDIPDVARVKLREIKNKIQRRNTALDQSNNTVSVKDVVKILMGPCKEKQGPVEHIFRGTLFINDRHHMEHSGFICVRAQSCIVMGGSPAKVSLSSRFGTSTDAARIPPSPRRFPSGGPPFDSGGRQKSGQRGHDSFVGSTIKIHIGHYKGCRGRVVSVKGQSVLVELESQMKTLTVTRYLLSQIEPHQHGIGSETPAHRAQTLKHSYATPTRNEGGTPRHSGSWTPLRDQAWNPNATTTPSGAKWEDGNPGSWGTIPPTQLLFRVRGSTIMVWITDDGHILMGADGLGFLKKIFEFDGEKRIKRRLDIYDDFTEDFSDGSECEKYYAELFQIISYEYGISAAEKMEISKRWLWRKQSTVLDNMEKAGYLGSGSNKIIYSCCGLIYLTSYVLILLRRLDPQPTDIRVWAYWCHHFLSTAVPTEFGFAEGDEGFYGIFLLASHENKKPLVFHMDRTHEPKQIHNYVCIGGGSVLGYKVLDRHYPKKPAKQLAVLRMREAFEACFLMRASGGTT
ncbi:hypothetical protein MKX03_008399, partial [Papaver bracteatum]